MYCYIGLSFIIHVSHSYRNIHVYLFCSNASLCFHLSHLTIVKTTIVHVSICIVYVCMHIYVCMYCHSIRLNHVPMYVFGTWIEYFKYLYVYTWNLTAILSGLLRHNDDILYETTTNTNILSFLILHERELSLSRKFTAAMWIIYRKCRSRCMLLHG